MSETSELTPEPTRGTRAARAGSAAARSAVRMLTARGFFVLATAVLAAALGLTLHWSEAIGIALAATLLLSTGLPAMFGTTPLNITLAAEHRRVSAHTAVDLTLTLRNASRRRAAPVMLELPLGDALIERRTPAVAAHGEAQLSVSSGELRRGVLRVGPATLHTRDPLRLVQRERSGHHRETIIVHPRTVILPAAHTGLIRELDGVARQTPSSADFALHAVREYVSGDERRHVDWRSTAKTSSLMVRQFDESQTARSAVVCDTGVSAYESADAGELAVSVAASLSLHAVRRGFVHTAMAGVTPLPVRTPTALLDAWAAVQLRPDPLSFVSRVQAFAQNAHALSTVFLVSGGELPAAQLSALIATLAPATQVVCVACVPLVDPSVRRAGAGMLLTVGELEDLPRLLLRGAAL